ncbi:shikimate kinase [Tundrisphaera sp. TA3]|uniref:shikimate kinase n=1 Tax=Tundrisphaera sp. TA3 TaxID=3435775 RepID=UPI003EBAE40B
MTADLPRRGGLALIGYRGTGKTSVGRIVAARTGRPFVDADQAVEARAGLTIRRIFEEQGEPAFREWESRILADLATSHAGGILATGGGAILAPANREILKGFGFVAWLTADPETLARRLRSGRHGVADRPALTASGTLGEIAEVLAARTPLYDETADRAIDTVRKTADQVADAVIEAWRRADTEGSEGR